MSGLKWQIKVGYATGDSNGSESATKVLEMEWESLDLAKQNLQRIKEHRDWTRGDARAAEPVWNQGCPHGAIRLLLDNGNTVQFHCPWIGYFEQFEWAEIIISAEGMRVEG